MLILPLNLIQLQLAFQTSQLKNIKAMLSHLINLIPEITEQISLTSI